MQKLLFFVTFFILFSVLSAVTVPSEWTCQPEWYGSDDGCHCNCGAQDPDCEKNIDLRVSPFLPTPKVNYWSTNGDAIHSCSNMCQDMICRNAKCYGVCNRDDYSHMHEDLRRVQIMSIINSFMIGLLVIVILAIVWVNCGIERAASETTIAVTSAQQLPEKSTFAKYILLDKFKRKQIA